MSDNALTDGDFWGVLLEACRPESAYVGVGRGQRSKSNWLPSSSRGRRVTPDKEPQVFHLSE
jgi:hypothetical protein